jgi:hypothetical protein
MTTSPRLDTTVRLARVGDHWGWIMGVGIVTLLAVVLGVWLVVQGGIQIGLAVRAHSVRHRARPLHAVSAM